MNSTRTLKEPCWFMMLETVKALKHWTAGWKKSGKISVVQLT